MKKFETYRHWTTEFSHRGFYQHLNEIVAFDEWTAWPTCEALETLLPYEVENRNNKTIRFVPQQAHQDFSAVAYEEVIFNTGKVPTRPESWHDLFGALTWCLFPQTKAKLNELHYKDIQAHGKTERTVQRNALTLFDECGVVLVTNNQEIVEALRGHDWHTAFIKNRDKWHNDAADGIAAYQFGHANYEMLTKPYIGLTGKWLLVEGSGEITSLPLSSQYRMVDQKLVAKLNDAALKDNSNLFPLPLLGVPGWYSENEQPEFYDNTDYFRPKRK